MNRQTAKLALTLLLALGAAAGGVQAQNKRDAAVLPVVDNASGKVQAYLLLEPTSEKQTGARWRSGSNTLGAAFGLEAGNSLALLCNRQSGLAGAVVGLANNCHLAELSDPDSHRAAATASFNRPGGRFGLTVGETKGSLPAWLARSAQGGSRPAEVELNDLTVFAQKTLGDAAYVSIAGTVAKATLIPFADAPANLGHGWDSKSLSVGGGYGAFSANIIGRVVDTPGQPKWEGLGLGLTWRTPWSGQLTVGAENIVTRGKNPFSPRNENLDEGAVPYVRYEQDL